MPFTLPLLIDLSGIQLHPQQGLAAPAGHLAFDQLYAQGCGVGFCRSA
jgi:hypothetical protein